MKSTLLKITLLACLGVGAIGTASSSSEVTCPTAAGKLTSARLLGGDWYVERVAPGKASGNSTYLWGRLAVIIKDKGLTEEEALKKGQEILDTSMWGNAEAFKYVYNENGDYFYRCEYLVQTNLIGAGNWIGLNSFSRSAVSPPADLRTNSMRSPQKAVQPNNLGIMQKLL